MLALENSIDALLEASRSIQINVKKKKIQMEITVKTDEGILSKSEGINFSFL